MSPFEVFARAACLALPIGAAWALVRRLGRPAWSTTVTLLAGFAAFVPAFLLEGWLRAWTGLEDVGRGTELVALIYAFFVAAPIEQGLTVAAFTPVFRTRVGATALDGVVYAGAAALGFVTARNAHYLFSVQASGFGAVVRSLVAVPAHVFFGATWGYAIGRDPNRRYGGRSFNLTWLVATLFNGVFDNIAFGRRITALIATLPILGCIAFVSWLGARDLLRDQVSAPRRPSFARRFLPAIAPPSIQAVRAALRRSERPVMLRWIGIGALTTLGTLTTSIAAAVVLGHRVGLDFAAVDRGDASASATVPLVLLGAAALAAFPVGGYLVTRASDARTVLESAIAAALAIASVLALLGLAAPVAVVFAIAFAPVAFGLACVGAWMGMTR